jgi:hypothetical protein
MKIVISGGTGFIGSYLSRMLVGSGYEVIVLSRSSRASKISGITNVKWDTDNISGWSEHINGCKAVINLAGDNIASGRWSDSKKKSILESRIASGKALERAVLEVETPPEVFIQASAIGFYGALGADPVTEVSPAGSNFLAEVCQKWENSSLEVEKKGIRRVVIRTGMVLGNGGALAKMLPPFKLGLGGAIGDGHQGVSWIHIDDEIGAIKYLIENDQCKGVFNLTAPSPVTFNRFAKSIGAVLGKPVFMRVPSFMMKIMMGQMAQEVILSGQFVLPEKLIAVEYPFEYVDVEAALRDIIIN